MPFKFSWLHQLKDALFVNFVATLTTMVVTNTHHVNKAIRPHIHDDVTCVTICTIVRGNKGELNSTAIVAPWLLSWSLFVRWFPGYRMETLVKERGGREIGKILNGLTRWEIRADRSDGLIQ